MKLPNRIFFTGAPGSRWSGVAQILESSGQFNISDRTSERSYSHNQYSGHVGVYFGNEMEFPAILDNEMIDSAWSRSEGCRLVKSHDWAYDLDNVYRHALDHGDWLLLIYRPDDASYNWWHQAGGFNICYPNYAWYQNSEKMRREITIQNLEILKFVNKHDLILEEFNSEWCCKNFNFVTNVGVVYSDVKICLVR
jgi:hypothetical protein